MARNLNDLKFEIQGFKEASTVFHGAGERGLDAMAVLLKNFAETQIAGPAKRKYVPVDTGNLKSSIRVEGPKVYGTFASVDVVAGGPAAPYAAAVHENPRSGKTHGLSPSGKRYKHWAKVGEWKYIETPAMIAAMDSRRWLKQEAWFLLSALVRLKK